MELLEGKLEEWVVWGWGGLRRGVVVTDPLTSGDCFVRRVNLSQGNSWVHWQQQPGGINCIGLWVCVIVIQTVFSFIS